MSSGGSAFPRPGGQVASMQGSMWWAAQDGMTLRDYFAAAALTGLCANSYNDGVHKPLSIATALEMAEMAYQHADEMLKQREPQGDADKCSRS